VIVGFCGETEAQFQATLRLLEAVGYDQVFAAAYSVRPGTPAAHLADDVPPADKRRRLNELLALQESLGFDRNRARVGAIVQVLVETIVPPRGHDHEPDPEPARARPASQLGTVHLTGRSRAHTLVHLDGSADLVGRLVDVRIDHAGPYSLRGALA
jgi:tRNA-2-methylthio-N6-dimethylallyladenosine synthase